MMLSLLIAVPAKAGDAIEAGAGSSLVTAAVSGGAARAGRVTPLPDVLSAGDAERYRKAFTQQERGQWAAADREIAGLHNRLLVAHLLAQRYLSPSYVARFDELRDWLAAHANHPDAAAVHALARKRAPKGQRGLVAPGQDAAARAGNGDPDASWEVAAYTLADATAGLGPADTRALAKLRARFQSLLRKGASQAAIALLDGELARFTAIGAADDLQAQLAHRLFGEGRDRLAARYAATAADSAGERLPGAHWTAGLAYWRQGDAAAARRYFENLANMHGSSWMVAAGAYWAARANLVSRRPEVVNHWLETAARHPRTFYGLLARRALGQPLGFGWEAAPFTEIDADNLQRSPAGRRALALLQTGQSERAETELRALAPRATPAMVKSMLALANAGGLPDLVLQLGSVAARQDGRAHDSAAFPVPSWTPVGGWTIDKALILALARQESGFDPAARSPAGAVGLMQLMPQTARFLGGESADKLTDPRHNLALGQRYVRYLLRYEGIDNNLFLMAAAYNAGVGNVLRWQQAMPRSNDPLLFIESLPSRETRVFVERVLTNLWIYRSRLGQPTPSLDAIVAGGWPIYEGSEFQLVRK